MRQRVLSAGAGLVILFTAFALFDTPFINFAVSAIIGMALSEVFIAADIRKHTVLYVAGIAFGSSIPLFGADLFRRFFIIICFVHLLVLLGIFLKWHDRIGVEQIGLVFFFSVFFSFSLNFFIMGRDNFGTVAGLYLVLVTFVAAWMSDTGAYFCGIRFGRHKLAPLISPKKTVEGAVGGIVVALLSQVVIALMFTLIMGLFGVRLQINIARVLIISPFLSIMGILGDLLASQTKRQYKIKDFGNIMPGHGGVVDRFDSVFLIVPPVYLLFELVPIIEIL